MLSETVSRMPSSQEPQDVADGYGDCMGSPMASLEASAHHGAVARLYPSNLHRNSQMTT